MDVNEGNKKEWTSWLVHYCEEYKFDAPDMTEEDCENEEDLPTDDQYLCKICAGEIEAKTKNKIKEAYREVCMRATSSSDESQTEDELDPEDEETETEDERDSEI